MDDISSFVVAEGQKCLLECFDLQPSSRIRLHLCVCVCGKAGVNIAQDSVFLLIVLELMEFWPLCAVDDTFNCQSFQLHSWIIFKGHRLNYRPQHSGRLIHK